MEPVSINGDRCHPEQTCYGAQQAYEEVQCSARRATTRPAHTSQFGRTPILSATREIALANTDVPIWRKWYSHEEAASVKNAS
jgi:hypothetical protein